MLTLVYLGSRILIGRSQNNCDNTAHFDVPCDVVFEIPLRRSRKNSSEASVGSVESDTESAVLQTLAR